MQKLTICLQPKMLLTAVVRIGSGILQHSDQTTGWMTGKIFLFPATPRPALEPIYPPN